MTTDDLFWIAIIFTLIGITIAMITPPLLHGIYWLYRRLFHRPRHLKKTRFSTSKRTSL